MTDEFNNKQFGDLIVGRNFADSIDYRDEDAIYLHSDPRHIRSLHLEEAEAMIDHLVELTEDIREKLNMPRRDGLVPTYITFGPFHEQNGALIGHPWITAKGYLTVLAKDRAAAITAVGNLLGSNYSFEYHNKPDESPDGYPDGELARLTVRLDVRKPAATPAQALALAVFAATLGLTADELTPTEAQNALDTILPLIEASGLDTTGN